MNRDAGRKLLHRVHVLHQAAVPRPPDRDEDHEPEAEPHRTRVARARVGDEREDPDDERQRRADERRERHLGAADADVRPGAVGPLEVRLPHP